MGCPLLVGKVYFSNLRMTLIYILFSRNFHALLTNREKCGRIYPSHEFNIYPITGKYFGKRCFLSFLIPLLGCNSCDNNWEGGAVSVRSFMGRTFLYADRGIYMSKEISKKVIDITGTELTPGEPTACLGNGAQGFACCCDECDYYLLCFPEFDFQIKRKNKTKIPHTLHDQNNA